MLDTDQKEFALRVLTLRSLVAALGETSDQPWWRTQFLGETSLRMMARIYPRTAVAAAINAASIAARAEHDRRIGAGNRYHLFRLPASIETALSSDLSQPEMQESLRAVLAGAREQLLTELERLGSEGTVRTTEGPISMGSAEGLSNPTCLAQLAARYHAAFVRGVQVFPYFDSASGRSDG